MEVKLLKKCWIKFVVESLWGWQIYFSSVSPFLWWCARVHLSKGNYPLPTYLPPHPFNASRPSSIYIPNSSLLFFSFSNSLQFTLTAMAPSFDTTTQTVCVMDASGHLGFNLVQRLLHRGYTVHASIQKYGNRSFL